MVSISRRRLRQQRKNGPSTAVQVVGFLTLALFCVGSVYLLIATSTNTAGGNSGTVVSSMFRPNNGKLQPVSTPEHPMVEVPDTFDQELYNTMALDVWKFLNCTKLFTVSSIGRRLDEQDDGGVEEDEEGGDDGVDMHGDDDDPTEVGSEYDARHVFCLAASTIDKHDLVERWLEDVNISCQPHKDPELRQSILDLWGTARAAFDNDDQLVKILSISTETTQQIVNDVSVPIWSPARDNGVNYVLQQLKDEVSADLGGFHGLTNLGSPDKVFVDVGSGLGIISIAMTLLYPGTHIISLEPAPPNWLLQEMNWQCNSGILRRPAKVLLAGIGPSVSGTQIANFVWRPYSTTSTRAWSTPDESDQDDLELKVKLEPWSSILEQTNLGNMAIDVLNVDCEGCEYNLIPHLTQSEYDRIGTIMGTIHWGYIPDSKKPSSKRAKLTHERLCRHENYARVAKECCAFPNLVVQSSVPGHILVQDNGDENSAMQFPQKDATVSSVTGDLCNDFDEWRFANKLDDIESDWGWFQLTSRAYNNNE